MWCEFCDTSTPSTKVTVRITRDGKELVIKNCELCGRRTEIEYFKGPTISIRVDGTPKKRKTPNHVRTNRINK